jgi:hypothetical protein
MNTTSKQLKKSSAKEDGKDLADRPVPTEFAGKLDRLIAAVDGLVKKIDDFQMGSAPEWAACGRPESDPPIREKDYWFLKKDESLCEN